MAKLRVGQAAPDVPLVTIDGEPIALSQAWKSGEHALIIFLRHLA